MFMGYIPIHIRHNPDITPLSKVVYAEITANLDEKGVCIKANSHFSKVFGASKQTISKAITQLRENNFIGVIIERDDDYKFKKRYITPLQFASGVNVGGYSQKFGGGGDRQKTGYPQKGDAVIDEKVPLSDVEPTLDDGGYAKNDEAYYSNNITYIKHIPVVENYNKNINEKQLAFLKNIVADFYKTQHKKYPNIIKSDWHKDHSLTHGSVNTLYDLIKIDEWNELKVRDTIRWAVTDEFWGKNIQSLKTLRNKSKNGNSKFANLYLKFDK